MKHLLICREYPPSPGGGIGTYSFYISRLLAENGETVHVIGQLWKGAEREIEEKCNGRLIIHRVPLDDWKTFLSLKRSPAIKSREAKYLFDSYFYPQCFSWQASILAEKIVEQERIDIIEAQEYEAPLYYFQLRRSLGLGPESTPPCIIHLHSPTEFTVRYNEWNLCHPYFLTAKRLEDYSIASADALISPSRYLADQVESHYGLESGTIHVIPYPIGDIPMIEREKYTWKHGSICYVGRLERRKGVIEWVDAAVTVAHEYPKVQFEFIGRDVVDKNRMSVQEFLERRIPGSMKKRFKFRGKQKHSSLHKFLELARMAVVPSRWENFPNTCIEAMCSGLPVIASHNGGMREMIKDGQTGWLTNKAGTEGLAEALKRALKLSEAEIEKMGRKASSDIRHICDNKKILESHLEFRSRIVKQGTKHSLRLPLNLPYSGTPLSQRPSLKQSKGELRKGLAIVVICSNNGYLLKECLKSLEQQTKKPVAVLVVDDGATDKQTIEILNQIRSGERKVIHKDKFISARNSGFREMLKTGLNPLGISFLNAEFCLQPDFVAKCEVVLQRCSNVGIVSCWTSNMESNRGACIRPCPSFPYQFISNDAAPFSAIRTEALSEVDDIFYHEMGGEYEIWDICNAVMSSGWVAITLPEILGKCQFKRNLISYNTNNRSFEKMYKKNFERYPNIAARYATDIELLARFHKVKWPHNKRFSDRDKLAIAVRMMIRHPMRSFLQALDEVRNKISNT